MHILKPKYYIMWVLIFLKVYEVKCMLMSSLMHMMCFWLQCEKDFDREISCFAYNIFHV
jgi:hypothetical protein